MDGSSKTVSELVEFYNTHNKSVLGRFVVVVDRGWIFAGDLCDMGNGYIRLCNAVHVLRWESIGFANMVKDWKSDKVHIRTCDNVEIPEGSVIFRIPVGTGWGIK